jgi:hypothetical protein
MESDCCATDVDILDTALDGEVSPTEASVATDFMVATDGRYDGKGVDKTPPNGVDTGEVGAADTVVIGDNSGMLSGVNPKTIGTPTGPPPPGLISADPTSAKSISIGRPPVDTCPRI